MGEKMLVMQALDERDFLKKKIRQKIIVFRCVDYVKNNEEKGVESRLSREEFTAQVQSDYQQITDLIARYQKVEAAILASNAATIITTSFGQYTVAEAIALRNRMLNKKKEKLQNAVEKRSDDEGDLKKDTDFEYRLIRHMLKQYIHVKDEAHDKNLRLEEQAETMRLSILGRDFKVRDDKPLAVVEAYITENWTELMDPLDAFKKVEELNMKKTTLLKEINTQIKISNATTLIEIA